MISTTYFSSRKILIAIQSFLSTIAYGLDAFELITAPACPDVAFVRMRILIYFML
jgi:hypothetical protein